MWVGGQGAEEGVVRRFVHHVHPLRPQRQALTVGGGERRTERQDGVAALQAQAGDAGRLGQDPVVRVVEEQAIATLQTQAQQELQQGRLLHGGPFVEDDHVHPAQLQLQAALQGRKRLRVVETDVDEREPAPELHQGAQAGAGHQVRDRPAAGRFVAHRRMPQPGQGAHEAAQEVGVAVVPVRAS